MHRAPDGQRPSPPPIVSGLAIFGGTMGVNGLIYGLAVKVPKSSGRFSCPSSGPFIALGTIPHADQGVATGLAIDWAVQSTGIVLFAIGIGDKTTTLVPVQPTIGLGTVGLRGTF